MRVRLHPDVAKLVNKNRKALEAPAEVNRALQEYYNGQPLVDVDLLARIFIENRCGKKIADKVMKKRK